MVDGKPAIQNVGMHLRLDVRIQEMVFFDFTWLLVYLLINFQVVLLCHLWNIAANAYVLPSHLLLL